MLHNCYHSQGINNGRQLEQRGFSLKTDLPLSHQKQFPHSLTFIYNSCNIFTIHTIFLNAISVGFFVCLFSWFLRVKLLNCQSLKQREFSWMKQKVKCYIHSRLCRYCRHYETTSKQDWFTLASDSYGLRWLTSAFYNDFSQIMIKKYDIWMLFYLKFRTSQRLNHENKLRSWQHLLFKKKYVTLWEFCLAKHFEEISGFHMTS